MTKKKKRLVVVLGMHRSGTSVVTRGLMVLGVQLGKGLLPPVKGVNEKGYWEDEEIYLFNTEMLAQFGRDWSNLAEISPIEVKILHQQGFFLRAVELLRKKTNDIPVFGFKDPRTTKLLPFWKDVFDHLKLDVSYVMVIRHPLSVVKSLAKRDDFPEEQSYLIWLGHVIPSLIESNGCNRVLVDYDTLMNSPEHEITRIAEFLDLKVKLDALQNYTKKFISENLRHTIYHPNDLLIADSAPPIVQEIYTALLDVATDRLKLDDIELQNKLTLWSDEFDRLKSPLALLDNLFCQKKELNLALLERDKQMKDLHGKILECNAQNTSLEQVLTARDILNSELNVRLADYESKYQKEKKIVEEDKVKIVSFKKRLSIITEDLGLNVDDNKWVVIDPLKFYYQGLIIRPSIFIKRKIFGSKC